VRVAHLRPEQRFTRALKAAGIFWAVALGCVFLPGLHFVLVPGFLLIGIGAGLKQVRDREVVSRVYGACPRCGREQDFASGNRLTPAWSLDCPACHNHLELTVDVAVPPA
jgi:hypothetical protein